MLRQSNWCHITEGSKTKRAATLVLIEDVFDDTSGDQL